MLHLVDIGLVVEGRPILHDLNLRVLPGEIHAILGMNGAGKSTLASVVMGLSGASPTSGNIYFRGDDITALPISARAKLGITLAWQEPARFEGLTVGEYLELGSHGPRAGGPPAEKCLRLVGLPPDRYLRRTVDSTLSGGERKRVELASILSMGPLLSILDEPDSGIDALSLNLILDAVRVLAKNGASVLLITHQIEVAGSADRASFLCGGTILRTGDPREIGRFFRMHCQECPNMGALPGEVALHG
ncbi:MAG: ATP-binding cassette domain-containing protein [Deltaproteobacteria bacterium]|nr:ATP-binding cassette domain-containing protein [Deltaproteobacteria bacterium]PWB63284.1 MAG: ABC transporter ATP-binding protein [Deltaproteobacteria bacterium]